MNFIEYTLTSDMLCMGERIKKGQFRPTVTTIPYSQITGALKAVFGDKDIHAVGYFPFEDEQEFRRRHVQILTYSPRDRAINTSIIPLYIEYLGDVKGRVFIAVTDGIRDDFKNESISIYMGAFKSKGFGGCTLKKCREIGEEDLEIREGLLNTRIPIAKAKDLNGMDGKSQKRLVDEGGTTEFLKNTFGIEKVVKARYGYLFEPTSKTSGWYVLSLFEGSVIKGPEFLLKDYDRGDRNDTQ
ncbi:hypothetical protein FHEFKHOI_01535 [Candidatus Methanoperedenaceae archaeon GB50]|nr:hypothetical protein FHEFKHOI_01535 [Candidatus Methanoperedenaceae archaeon GB50]CAD7777535.1 MAG: hypothetical protein KBONHNOK_01055 [Candidatus Methanoperedenaceae archaeon GB50]